MFGALFLKTLNFLYLVRDNQEYLFVCDTGIKMGDTFRVYHSDSTAALSSVTAVSNHMRSLSQSSTNTAGSDKREVFGGLIFTCCDRGDSFFGQPNIDSSPFLNNFPGVTLGGTFCGGEIGRGDLTLYDKESQEQKWVHGCLQAYSGMGVYFVMSYHENEINVALVL